MTHRFDAMGCEVEVRGADAPAVAELFAAREATFSRFRTDSELSRVNGAAGDPLLVSESFAHMLRLALDVARTTGGLVTPTVGAAVRAAGYDRDFRELPTDGPPAARARVPSWRRVRIAGRWLFRDGPVELDLNGVVKGATVDDALALLGAGSLGAGGDIATTEPVDVELPGGVVVSLRSGGLATSGTDRRSWLRGGVPQHHLIDSTTGRPCTSPWQLVTVAAGSCLAADVAAKAALLLGAAGPSWLDRRSLPGRFVDAAGRVTLNVSWSAALGEPQRRAA